MNYATSATRPSIMRTILIGIILGAACGPAIDDDHGDTSSDGTPCFDIGEPCEAHAECCDDLVCSDVTGEQRCRELPSD